VTLIEFLALPENVRAAVAKNFGLSYEVLADGRYRLRVLNRAARRRSPIPSAN
jgi:hypothetical protein